MALPGIGLPKLPVSLYDPMAKYTQYYAKPVGVRKVGDKKFMHNAQYEWTGSYWKCLEPEKRTFTVVHKIPGIEAKKKVLEEQLDLKPGSGMSYKAMTEALAAGGMEAWREAKAAKLPIPKVKVPTIIPDVIEAEGDFEVVAGEAIRDKATGKIIGYIGASNQLMDIHGTVIGNYVGDRKIVSKVSLATFKAVPEREGIPYCEAKNYDKAKEYLVKLMDAGEVPGGSTLVQRHNEWVYIPPKPENETMKLDTGEWIYKQEYDKLPINVQDYLHEHGVQEFIDYFIPAQQYVATETKKQLKPYEIRGTVPPDITNPAFVKYIKSLKGYDWIGALEDGVSPRIIKQFFEELPKGIVNPAFVKYMRENAYIDSIVAAIQSGVDHNKLIEIFGKKKYATAKAQCDSEEQRQYRYEQMQKAAPTTMAGLSQLSIGERVKQSLKATVTDPFFVMNELGDSIGNIQEFSKQQPTNIITAPYKIATGLLTGVAMIMVMPAMLWAILGQPTMEARVRAAKEIGKGTVTFFATIPVAMKADPYFTSGMIAGMILGPKGVLRTAKTARVWVDPYGVPARTIAVEFSTGRAMISKLSQADLGLAMDLAHRQIAVGKLQGTVVVKGVKINYRGAPIQQTVGEILFSATPDATNFIKPGTIYIKPGGIYTSLSAPLRFMAGGAKGTIPIKYPAIISILTDIAKIQRVPKSVLGRATQSDWYIRQAHEGFHNPSKIYHHAFESEIVGAKGTKLTHAPKTLRSRIFGTKAGDLFTQYTGADVIVGTTKITKGQLVPMIFLLDKGVFRTPPSPALMYATKLLTIKESLLDFKQALKHPLRTTKDIIGRRIGPKGAREIETYRVTNVAEWATKITEEAIKKSKQAPKMTKEGGYVYPEAFRRALVESFEAHRARIYRLASGVLEKAYEANPKIYEELYRYNLERNLRAATRAYSTARARADMHRGVERGLPEVRRYKPVVPRDRDYVRQGITEPRLPRTTRRELPRPRIPVRGRPKTYRIRRAGITTTVPPPPKPRIILLPSGESLSLTKEQWEGIIAWKQGIMYKMIYPPYGVKDIVNSRKTLAGVKYHKGAGSAYKSVLAKGGKVPPEVLRDMGIMDLRFRTDRPTSKKPKLFYKRDIKQRTRTTPTTPGISGMK